MFEKDMDNSCYLNVRIYVDDLRPVPPGYIGAKSVNETIKRIERYEGLYY